VRAPGRAGAIIRDSIDTSTATGRLLRTVLAALAEMKRDLILERTSNGKREALDQGAVYRANTLGYVYHGGNKRQGLLARVAIDPVGAALVRRIFTTVAAGTSLHDLARQLNQDGVPTPRKGAYWRVGTLRKIVYNDLYLGQARYGSASNDAPAIIAPALALAAREQLGRNRVLAKRNCTHEYLVGGLVHCAAPLPDGTPCGSSMHGEQRGPHHNPRYRCSHRGPGGYQRHCVATWRVADAVWRALRATLSDSSTVLDDLKALADAGSAKAARAEDALRHTEKAIREIDAQRDVLLDLHLAQRLDADRWAAKDAALLGRQQALMDKHASLAAQRNAALSAQLPIAEVEDLCRRLAGKLDTLTFAQRQRLVRTLFTRISVDRTTVYLDGVFDTLSMTVALRESDAPLAVEGAEPATGAAATTDVAPCSRHPDARGSPVTRRCRTL
jgi:site-specific DNA recombinase